VVNFVWLRRSGADLGVGLAETSVDYHGAKMKVDTVDTVDADRTVFVEAFP
jgi:hypothetical protein